SHRRTPRARTAAARGQAFVRGAARDLSRRARAPPRRLAHHQPAARQPVHPRSLRRARPREDAREAAALLNAPFRHRGIVEGFYGRPWAHADRLWWVEQLARLGMNTYLVAPKADPLQRQ